MLLATYNLIRDLQRLERDLDKLWGVHWGPPLSITETYPMDMYEKDGNLVAELTLPSLVNASGDTTKRVLKISGQAKRKKAA